MMGKLRETQQKIEDTKKRLDTVLIDEQSNDNLLKVTLTANTFLLREFKGNVDWLSLGNELRASHLEFVFPS